MGEIVRLSSLYFIRPFAIVFENAFELWHDISPKTPFTRTVFRLLNNSILMELHESFLPYILAYERRLNSIACHPGAMFLADELAGLGSFFRIRPF